MQKLIAQGVFGTIEPPAALSSGYGTLGSGGPGITGLISNVIVFIAMAGGLFALFNIVTGAFGVITAGGDPKKLSDLGNKLSMTFVGLAVLVGAPVIAALLGFIILGSGTSLLNPTIVGPGTF